MDANSLKKYVEKQFTINLLPYLMNFIRIPNLSPLFDKDFVKRNKNNCKLIIDGKEQELIEKYSFGWFSSKKDILEIKLKGITNITNMSFMFDRCKSLSSSPDISKWNTSNATYMIFMFSGCNESLKIPSKFNE